MILRRENIALIVAERNLLSSVGRDLALALLSSRTLGISRHVFGQTTSLPASLFSWMCASELRDKQDFIQSAPMWARATAVSACNGTPERRQRAAVPPFDCHSHCLSHCLHRGVVVFMGHLERLSSSYQCSCLFPFSLVSHVHSQIISSLPVASDPMI